MEIWSHNTQIFNVMMGLKIKYGGKIPPHLLAAMSEIQHDLPVKPQSFGRRRSLQTHFEKHAELGFANAAEYEKAALRFAGRTSPSSMVLESRANRNWVKFDPATKEYAVLNQRGELVTYFKKDRFTGEQAFERFLSENTHP